MGVAGDDVGDQGAVAQLVDALTDLNKDLKVPTPKAYGIDENKYTSLIDTMADQALASGSPNNNPRVPTKDEIVALYKQVWA
jgi:alcohol dehydrogenase class IV